FAFYAHAALGRRDQVDQAPSERRFAAAAFADQPDDLAGTNVQRDAVDGAHQRRLFLDGKAPAGYVQLQAGEPTANLERAAQLDDLYQWSFRRLRATILPIALLFGFGLPLRTGQLPWGVGQFPRAPASTCTPVALIDQDLLKFARGQGERAARLENAAGDRLAQVGQPSGNGRQAVASLALAWQRCEQAFGVRMPRPG